MRPAVSKINWAGNFVLLIARVHTSGNGCGRYRSLRIDIWGLSERSTERTILRWLLALAWVASDQMAKPTEHRSKRIIMITARNWDGALIPDLCHRTILGSSLNPQSPDEMNLKLSYEERIRSSYFGPWFHTASLQQRLRLNYSALAPYAVFMHVLHSNLSHTPCNDLDDTISPAKHAEGCPIAYILDILEPDKRRKETIDRLGFLLKPYHFSVSVANPERYIIVKIPRYHLRIISAWWYPRRPPRHLRAK